MRGCMTMCLVLYALLGACATPAAPIDAPWAGDTSQGIVDAGMPLSDAHATDSQESMDSGQDTGCVSVCHWDGVTYTYVHVVATGGGCVAEATYHCGIACDLSRGCLDAGP